jgi:hypothetical protein
MAGFFGSIPWWGWVIIVGVLAALVTPIKLKVFKKMAAAQKRTQQDPEE